jgi:hypothetical protein
MQEAQTFTPNDRPAGTLLVSHPRDRQIFNVMANLLTWMRFLEAEDLDNIASARGIAIEAVGLSSRKRALDALREVASLRFLRFAESALATLRRLKIKPRR